MTKMATLLYHWDFTSSVDITNASGTTILDKRESLEAKIIYRGDGNPTDKVSRNSDGIFLNNETDGKYCIDLSGLDNKSISGDISMEMVIKNKDLSKKAIYFQSISDVSNNDSAYFTFRNNDSSKTILEARTDSKSLPDVVKKSVNIPISVSNINTDDFFHYVFTIKSADISGEIKIYINHDEARVNKEVSFGKSLSGTLRESNLIGTQKNPIGANYLHGVVKYIKLYKGILDEPAVETLYENYIGTGNICFLGSEKVETDQGKVRFDDLTIDHTILGKKIKKIVKVFNSDSSLIFISKHALGKKIPTKNTYISRNHGVYLDKEFIETNQLEPQIHPLILDIAEKNMVRARNLIKMKTVMEVSRNKKDLLYNVLLEQEGKMVVNGILCETLNPNDELVKKFI